MTIERLAAGGDGLGYIDDKVCFVPYGVPRDRLKVTITRKNKKFYRASIEEIIDPSPDRIPVPCSHFTQCGGCRWLQIDERVQLLAKQAILSHALRTPVSIVPSRPSLGYRSVVRLHIGTSPSGLIIGFVHARTRRIVKIDACPILVQPLNNVLPTISNLTEIAGHPAGEIRLTSSDHGPVACFSSSAPFPEPFYNAARNAVGKTLLGVSLANDVETHLAGTELIHIIGTDGSPFEAPAKSFGQANRYINQDIARTVERWLANRRFSTAAELFAGAGNHTITVAPRVDRMIASEIDPAACDAMKRNLARRHLDHVSVVQGEALEQYSASAQAAELLVLNPPRTGHLALASAMARGNHRAVLYISCNPATLARDLAELLATGYNIREAKGFDMFPHTAHMEAAVLLERS